MPSTAESTASCLIPLTEGEPLSALPRVCICQCLRSTSSNIDAGVNIGTIFGIYKVVRAPRSFTSFRITDPHSLPTG